MESLKFEKVNNGNKNGTQNKNQCKQKNVKLIHFTLLNPEGPAEATFYV
jgi:hypothetical protein